MRFGNKVWVGAADAVAAAAVPARQYDAPQTGSGTPGSMPVAKTAPFPPGKWPEPRIAAVQSLWGDGFIAPGGATEAIRLAEPLALDQRATLLLVGGGLGGPAHAIATTFDTWVTSCEAEPVLAAIASKRAALLNDADGPDSGTGHMTFAAWDTGNPTFMRNSSNHVLSLEALRGTQAAPFVDAIAGALRPHGQVVMTELVADLRPDGTDREFAAWCRLENRLPALPKPEEVSAALTRQHFDVRVVEDISDRHVTQTLAGWRGAVRGLSGGPRPAVTQAAAFVTEAELWLLRIRLMRRLGLRLMRWHAISAA